MSDLTSKQDASCSYAPPDEEVRAFDEEARKVIGRLVVITDMEWLEIWDVKANAFKFEKDWPQI